MSSGDRRLDAFASMFRRAWHPTVTLTVPSTNDVVLLVDGSNRGAQSLASALTERLSTNDQRCSLRVEEVPPGTDHRLLLAALAERPPDLVVTWRNMGESHGDLPHSLGTLVDEITQTVQAPLLLLPTDRLSAVQTPWSHVMVVTDHLNHSDVAVSWAARLCENDGTLYLAHIEDDANIERVLAAIGRIPELDTDIAKAALPEALLSEPRQYVEAVAEALELAGIEEVVIPIVTQGHALSDYRRLVETHTVDLLVVPSRDERQLAMHSLSHALAVELRERPLLLL